MEIESWDSYLNILLLVASLFVFFGFYIQMVVNLLLMCAVCDVAEVILLAYKNPDAVGRYIC